MTPRPLTITGGKLVLPEGEPQTRHACAATRAASSRWAMSAPQDGDDVIDAQRRADRARASSISASSRSTSPRSISAGSPAPR